MTQDIFGEDKETGLLIISFYFISLKQGSFVGIFIERLHNNQNK